MFSGRPAPALTCQSIRIAIAASENAHFERASEWVEVLKKIHERKIQILAFANNHYAGFGPGTIEEFRALWRRAGQ